MKAVMIETGEEVKPGNPVLDFRGKLWTLRSITRANEPGRDGKVVVSEVGQKQGAFGGREFYARVFGLRVE